MKKHLPEISAHTHTPDRAPSEKHDLECDLCGNKWAAALASVTYRARKQGRTVGCPICNKEAHRQHLLTDHHRKADNSKVDDELARIGFKLLEPYTNAKSKHKMQCVCCGSISDNTTVLSRKQMAKKLNQVGCVNCSPNQRQAFRDQQITCVADLDRLVTVDSTAHLDRLNQVIELLRKVHMRPLDDFVSRYEPCTVECIDCGHKEIAVPETKSHAVGHGCPICREHEKQDIDVIRRELVVAMGGNVIEETKTRMWVEYQEHTISVPKHRLRKIDSLNEFLPSDQLTNKAQVVVDRLSEAGVEVVGKYTKWADTHKFHCMTCGHGDTSSGYQEWITTPQIISQTYLKYGTNGCPVCSEHRRFGEARSNTIARIEKRGFTILSEDYNGHQSSLKKIKVRRQSCGHEFETSPNALIFAEVECPVCIQGMMRSASIREKNLQSHLRFVETAPEWIRYRNDVDSATRKQFVLYESIINPNNYQRGLSGQENAYQLDHIISARFCFDNDVPVEMCADYRNLQMLPWYDNLIKGETVNIDHMPSHIFNYMLQHNRFVFPMKHIIKAAIAHVYSDPVAVKFDVEFGSRKADVVIPDAKLAVRLISFDYNQAVDVGRNHCIDMLEAANDQGYRLIQVFEDEWMSNQKLIISKILHAVGIQRGLQSIGARQCTIQLLTDSSIKNKFLDEHHIQGSDTSSIKYGAYHNDQLVGVMTFGNPRLVTGNSNYEEGTWELVRFATDTNARYPGLASKMLMQFINDTNPKTVITYADRRWSDGNLYIKMGFECVNPSPNPGYFYLENGERKHRWQRTKGWLKENYDQYDENKSEYEMMLERGVDRIYDCGSLKFQLSVDEN